MPLSKNKRAVTAMLEKYNQNNLMPIDIDSFFKAFDGKEQNNAQIMQTFETVYQTEMSKLKTAHFKDFNDKINAPLEEPTPEVVEEAVPIDPKTRQPIPIDPVTKEPLPKELGDVDINTGKVIPVEQPKTEPEKTEKTEKEEPPKELKSISEYRNMMSAIFQISYDDTISQTYRKEPFTLNGKKTQMDLFTVSNEEYGKNFCKNYTMSNTLIQNMKAGNYFNFKDLKASLDEQSKGIFDTSELFDTNGKVTPPENVSANYMVLKEESEAVQSLALTTKVMEEHFKSRNWFSRFFFGGAEKKAIADAKKVLKVYADRENKAVDKFIEEQDFVVDTAQSAIEENKDVNYLQIGNTEKVNQIQEEEAAKQQELDNQKRMEDQKRLKDIKEAEEQKELEVNPEDFELELDTNKVTENTNEMENDEMEI